MKNRNILYLLLLAATCGAACFAFFRFAYAYHLVHREQMLLFTYTAEQLTAYLKHPALLSCLGGDFLTQLFHYPTAGACCLTAGLLATGIVAFTVCRKWTGCRVATGIGLLVFAWESLRFCDINHTLAGTLSLIGGMGMFLATDKLKGFWKPIAGNAGGTLLCYWLFGYGMFIFAWLTVLSALTRKKNYPVAILSLSISLLLPFAMAGSYLMMPAKAYTYPANVWFGIPDFENERILGLATENYMQHYEQIDKLVHDGAPANSISVCYNLANAMHGRLAERLMDYYQPAALGLFMPVNETSTYLSTQLAGEVWFQLGDMTMAEHAAMLSMIFSPQNKNVRMVQRLAEINLINGDEEAARKYLRILKKTTAYRQWATDRTPGQESKEVKKWLEQKRALLPTADTLRLTSTDVVKSLHLLLEANSENRMAREYLLCLDLLMKDLAAFTQDYEKYHQGPPNRLYAEALMIHLYRQRATGEEVKSKNIAPQTVQAFNEYNRLHAQCQGDPNVLRNRFGKTYWFYYQFAQFQ